MDEKNRHAVRLFAGLPGRYDTLAQVLGLGRYLAWRRELVRLVAAVEPARILDVATGTAGVATALAGATSAGIVGADINTSMLAQARESIGRHGLAGRIRLCQARAEALPFGTGSFDAVSFTYLLRYVEDPAATLGELGRVLKPGGLLAGLDFGVPPNPFWHLAWLGYTRAALPVAGGLLGGRSWWDVGRCLGPSISEHGRRWPPEQLAATWRDAGFVDVRRRRLSLGGGLLMWGRRAP